MSQSKEIIVAAAIERPETGKSQIKVARWLNVSPSVIHILFIFYLGNVNAHTYRDHILDVYVHPYAGAKGDAFVLRDDNMRPHRARILNSYLEQETIQHLITGP
ncbi:transposable element Tcb1 transposase [Trichonephila clavipes]|nr:transposable element Tcb1 transposase [Trichonephila clavipes]